MQVHGVGRRCVGPYVASLVLVIGDAFVGVCLFGVAFAPRDPELSAAALDVYNSVQYLHQVHVFVVRGMISNVPMLLWRWLS